MKFTFLSEVVNDTYLIMYKFHRSLRRSDPVAKATTYAEEFAAYYLAMIVFDLAFVPLGGLMACLNIRFTIARYILLVCMLAAIIPSKTFALALLRNRSHDDQTLLGEFNTLTVGRWVAWLSYLILTVLLACVLGYYYSKVPRLR